MERDRIPFPKIDLFPRTTKVARFLLNRHPAEPQEHHLTHRRDVGKTEEQARYVQLVIEGMNAPNPDIE